MVRQRLWDRYNAGSDAEKAIRRQLGEVDDEYIARIDARYAQLKRDNWFDLCLRTDQLDVEKTADELLLKVL